jgi:hypothetical protein
MLVACGGEESTATSDAGKSVEGTVASDVPEIKAGLWRVTVIAESGPQFPAESICLSEADANAKKGLGERAAELPCEEKAVTREGAVVVTNAICNIGGVKRTIQTRAHGDFQADYWIDYVENVDPPPADAPAELKRRIHARWLGERC